MKRSILAFAASVLLLAGFVVWALELSIAWNGQGIVMAGLALALVAVAVLV